MDKVVLIETKLSGAQCVYTNLSKANFRVANLKISKFFISKIKQAKNWKEAIYDEEIRKKLFEEE